MNSGKSAHGGCQLVDRSTGRVVVESLELATTFWQRFCGWQFRALPPTGSGLLLVPCNSVHTFGMRFAIDVAFLADDGRLVALRSHVAPWQVVAPVREAKVVLEVPSGRCLLEEGQRLGIVTAGSDWLRPQFEALLAETAGGPRVRAASTALLPP